LIKKVYKYFISILFLFFIFLYFFGGNIYGYKLTERKNLTIEQINKFENDIKNGVEIDLNDYLIKDKYYGNAITEINGNISHVINAGLKKIFQYFLKKVDV